MSFYNHHTRQEVYDSVKHHAGRAEHHTINMVNHGDWQLYGQRRTLAFKHTVQALIKARELWDQDNVLMGSWAGRRADWMADLRDDLRSIAKYIDVEQNLIQAGRTEDRKRQREGMHKAWTRVRGTISKVHTANAKHA